MTQRIEIRRFEINRLKQIGLEHYSNNKNRTKLKFFLEQKTETQKINQRGKKPRAHLSSELK